jgi:hypothetical protein
VAPRKFAKTISRAKPKTRESIVITPTTRLDFNKPREDETEASGNFGESELDNGNSLLGSTFKLSKRVYC